MGEHFFFVEILTLLRFFETLVNIWNITFFFKHGRTYFWSNKGEHFLNIPNKTLLNTFRNHLVTVYISNRYSNFLQKNLKKYNSNKALVPPFIT